MVIVWTKFLNMPYPSAICVVGVNMCEYYTCKDARLYGSRQTTDCPYSADGWNTRVCNASTNHKTSWKFCSSFITRLQLTNYFVNYWFYQAKQTRSVALCGKIPPPPPVSLVILQVQVLLSVYAYRVALGLVIIDSNSAHLVWMPRDQ